MLIKKDLALWASRGLSDDEIDRLDTIRKIPDMIERLQTLNNMMY